jgi:hypothetical protein
VHTIIYPKFIQFYIKLLFSFAICFCCFLFIIGCLGPNGKKEQIFYYLPFCQRIQTGPKSYIPAISRLQRFSLPDQNALHIRDLRGWHRRSPGGRLVHARWLATTRDCPQLAEDESYVGRPRDLCFVVQMHINAQRWRRDSEYQQRAAQVRGDADWRCWWLSLIGMHRLRTWGRGTAAVL